MGEHPSGIPPGHLPGHGFDWRLATARAGQPPPGSPLPQDIAFLAGGELSQQALHEAARVAGAKGIAASDILIHRGLIRRADYERRLAHHVGAAYSEQGPDPTRVDAIALANTDELRVPGAIEHGPVGRRLFVSPEASGYQRVATMAQRAPDTFRRSVFTGRTALRQSLFERSRTLVADRATGYLEEHLPEFSARRRVTGPQLAGAAAIALVAFAAMMIDWRATLSATALLLSTFYLAIIVLRGILIAHLDDAVERAVQPFNPPTTDPEDYPVYSVLVALYREAGQVSALVRALDRLDWPRTKKEVFLVCEEDDPETLAAIRAFGLPEGFHVVACPASLPRTKPKALDVALPLCSGEFVVIYDAEDRPDRMQLREAWRELSGGDPRLACVQAPLLVDNDGQNWLTRLFAIEYLTLFRGTLPVLSRLKAPLPLGGTSNHFKTAILRAAGGWDPYNVTEDADLGIRLYRLGWRCATITRPTWEEAPASFPAWLRQRTRWQKGWLQTILVHSRQPFRTARELGLTATLYFHLTITAIVVSALIHPFYLALVAWQIARVVAGDGAGPSDPLVLGISMFNLVGGYTTYGVLCYGVQSMTRKRLSAGWLLTLPAYWLAISLAGWRALFQFAVDPFRWEKTPHGLAKSRRNANI